MKDNFVPVCGASTLGSLLEKLRSMRYGSLPLPTFTADMVRFGEHLDATQILF
jgi:hypothetical protein